MMMHSSNAPPFGSSPGELGAAQPVLLPELDYPLIGAALALLGLGLVMISSSTLHVYSQQPFYFVIRHAIALLAGAIAALIVYRIPIHLWRTFGGVFFVIGLLLLTLLMIPGVGHEVNGATRWFRPFGVSIQPSEFVKLFAILYIAGYLARHQQEITASAWAFLRPLLLIILACALIMWQPDFGTVGVIVVTTMGMLFLGGVALHYFGILFALAASALVSLVLISPYRMSRMTSFTDPWADVHDGGYQLAQALIAFGRGEWSGVGLGNGIQKQFYLPEAHTDFIMAVIGEELGLLGSLLVISLFAVIVWRAFAIGAAAERLGNMFAAWLAQGLGLWLAIQSAVNIGVNIGALPTKGLTLPLMSYGGNSIVIACVAIAILVRIDRENRQRLTTQNAREVWAV